MIRNSTIPAVGRVGKRWASWRRSQAAIVKERAGGICEGCGKDSRRLEVAHLMGRRNLIAEPWASWHGMCAHLCSAHPDYGLGCHEQNDGRKNEPLRQRLLAAAAYRLGERAYDVEWVLAFPADGIRKMVRHLEAAGIEP